MNPEYLFGGGEFYFIKNKCLRRLNNIINFIFIRSNSCYDIHDDGSKFQVSIILFRY